MSQNISQKSSDKSTMTIEEEDLFTYWLTRVWPIHTIDFDEFKDVMKEKGVKIINTNDFVAF